MVIVMILLNVTIPLVLGVLLVIVIADSVPLLLLYCCCCSSSYYSSSGQTGQCFGMGPQQEGHRLLNPVLQQRR